MSEIARLDAVRNLKQFFELSGNVALELAGSVLPVALIANLDEGAYSLGIPFLAHNTVGAVAGEHGWVGIRIDPTAPHGTRINVRRVFVTVDVQISVSSEEPSASTGDSQITAARQSGTQVRSLIPAQVTGGTRVAAPSSFGIRFSSPTPIEVDLTIFKSRDDQGNLNPCIFCHHHNVNTAFSAGFFGYIHVGGGR